MSPEYKKRLQEILDVVYPKITELEVTNRELFDVSFTFIGNMYRSYLQDKTKSEFDRKIARSDIEKRLKAVLDKMETL